LNASANERTVARPRFRPERAHSTSNTVLQTIVPDEMRGRVMGVWSLAFGAMIPLGSLEAGALAHWLGTPFALAFGGIICAVTGLVTLFVIRRREAASAR
jgi:sugar phosphate permease